MAQGVVYRLDSGLIQALVTAPDEEGVQIQIMGRETELGVYMEALDMQTQYLVDGEPVDRPVMALGSTHPLSESVQLKVGEVIEVTGIPKGAKVYHPEGMIQVDDGFIDWGSDTPGTYQLHLVHAPYQEVTINAIVG